MMNTIPKECASGAHCWHADAAQPAVLVTDGRMTAFTCCHCGKRKTETVRWKAPGQHGPFAR